LLGQVRAQCPSGGWLDGWMDGNVATGNWQLATCMCWHIQGKFTTSALASLKHTWVLHKAHDHIFI